MDARMSRAAAIVAAAVCSLGAFCSLGAGYRTQNFIASAPTAEQAREFCETAERCRRDLALDWLGSELPRWPAPCPLQVVVGPRVAASGETSFTFVHGQPHDWHMIVRGSRERLIDSVIPHEVTHTIFATHFGRPLPRWADEGACTSIEADEETNKHKKLLIQFLTTGQGIAFNRMFAMTQYPQNILPLYSQGYSLARYLIGQGGKQKFVNYIGEGMHTNNWPETTRRHYGFTDLSDLQVTWLEWVRQGCPPLEQAPQFAGAHFRQAMAGQVAGTHNVNPMNNNAETESAAPRRDQDAVASSGGWYSKLRDAAQSGQPLPMAEFSPPTDDVALAQAAVPQASAVQKSAAPYRPGSIGRQSLARQQPIGRPGQTVLDQGNAFAPSRYDYSSRPQPSSLR